MEKQNKEQQKVKGINAISAKELQDTNIPELNSIVENMLYEGLAILAGAPKCGKSWISLQLGLALSQGKEFLGFETTKSDVLYLALEDSYRRLQDRLNIMIKGENAPERLSSC